MSVREDAVEGLEHGRGLDVPSEMRSAIVDGQEGWPMRMWTSHLLVQWRGAGWMREISASLLPLGATIALSVPTGARLHDS